MRQKLTAVILAAIMLTASVQVFAADSKQTETNLPAEQEPLYSGEYNAFDEIAGFIAENYIDENLGKDEITAKGLSGLLEGNEELLVKLLKSTLESMDDYSEFLTAEEYKAFQESLEKTFYGIGVVMKQSQDGYIEIAGFTQEDGAAQKAGFKVGDKICAVDGKDVTGKTVSEVREKVIGEENTEVKITVLRENQKITLTAVRVAVHESTVSGGILKGNIGYIAISSFNSATASEFEDALDDMRKNDVKKIIMDLRYNGGGIVTSAVEMAKQIVPKGKIVDVKYRDSRYDVTYNSELSKKEFDFIVLVNDSTASASEILASAVQDSGAGILLGTTTFGKAVIQNMFPLTNGAVIKMTVGQYFTRNGHEINHIGLTPDEQVENIVSPINTSEYAQFDFTTRNSLGSSHENVKAAKQRLKVLGFYDADAENSVFDADFKETIKSFQQANNLFSYGVLDVVTQAKIDELFSSIEVMSDEQLKAAYVKFGGKEEDLFVK